MNFICSILSILYFSHVQICSAIPIKEDKGVLGGSEETEWSSGVVGTLIGVSSAFCLILVIGVCVCCGKEYFKWPRSHGRRINRNSGRNGAGIGGNEISIFPPPGADQYLSSSTSDIYFEPLPDITSQLNDRNRLPRLSASVSSILNEEWFAEPYKNFPRNQLQYVRKLGSGWFGQVLEGRAIGVDTDHTSTVITKGLTSQSTPVVVKALREDASSQEQAFFLQELTPYRDLNHKNVLRIVAYCLETQPLLVLLQHCPKGDLKTILRKDASLTEHQLLTMAENVSAGLSHMHQFNFIHTDLAARNCLVEEDLNVKIGDYGFSLETYQNEYYLAENVALPIRWCAPETLNCTETTIETIELTKNANVWSFGVVLWEILSRGQLPYEELDEDGVIQKVVLERSHSLTIPLHISGLYASKLDEILRSCFSRYEKRPAIAPIHFILSNLCAGVIDDTLDNDLDERWNRLADASSQVQQHNILIGNNSLDMRFESDFNPRNLAEKGSPTASLKNLHGSAEDLDARIAAKFGSAFPSWLGLEPGQAMDSFTEEISDAIQRLDEALSEDVSESTTCVSSPEKTSVNFKLGRDSLVLNPPGTQRTLSDGEEENLTMRLEQGDFSELVRLKSQSVQDFMRLTVVDDGSDSSDKTSQPGSLIGGELASSTQEKNFSSESNLKEAVRDAGFMVELEKLQAEHNKFSIISEVSREGMSSLDYCPTDNLAEERLQSINEDETGTRSFLVEETPSSMMKGSMEVAESSETMLNEGEGSSTESSSPFEGVREKDASPDCIISSRDAIPVPPLPDIISHDGCLKRSNSSSSSSFDETGNKIVAEKHDESQGLRYFSSVDHSPRSVLDSSYTSRSNGSYEGVLDEKMEDKTNLNFSSDIVMGEDVIIGALDDFSLDLYKPVKSSYIDPKEPVDNSFILDSYPLDINNADYDHNDNNMGLICVNSVTPQFEESSNSCFSDQTLSNTCDKSTSDEGRFFDPSKMNGLIQPTKSPLNLNEKEEVGKLSHVGAVSDPTPQIQPLEGEWPLSNDFGYSSNLDSKGESCIDIPLSNLNDLITDVSNELVTDKTECASNEGELLSYEESQNITYSKDDLPFDSQSTNLDPAFTVKIMTETTVENQISVVSPLSIDSSQTNFEKFSSSVADCDSDINSMPVMLFPATESHQSSSPKENEGGTTKAESETGGNEAESPGNEVKPDNADAKLIISELHHVEDAALNSTVKEIDKSEAARENAEPISDTVEHAVIKGDAFNNELETIKTGMEIIGINVESADNRLEGVEIGILKSGVAAAKNQVHPIDDEIEPSHNKMDAFVNAGEKNETKITRSVDASRNGESENICIDNTKPTNAAVTKPISYETRKPMIDEVKSIVGEVTKPLTEVSKPMIIEAESITDEVSKPMTDEVEPITNEVSKPITEEVMSIIGEINKPLTEISKPMIIEVESKTDEVSKPLNEEVKPIADEVKPMIDEVKPMADEIKSMTDGVEQITDEVSKPMADEVKPMIDEVKPMAGEIKPMADEVKPMIDEVKPMIDEVKPIIDEVKPMADEVKPMADEVKPMIDEVKPMIDEIKSMANEVSKPMANEAKPITDDVKSMVDEVKLIKPMAGDEPITDELLLIGDKVEHIANEVSMPTVEESKPVTEEVCLKIADEVKPIVEESKLVGDSVSKPVIYEAIADRVVSIANELMPIANEIKPVSAGDSKPMTDEFNLIDNVEPINDESMPQAVDVKPMAYEDGEPMTDEFKTLADETTLIDVDVKPMAYEVDKPIADETIKPMTDVNIEPMTDIIKPISKDIKPVADEVKPITDIVKEIADIVQIVDESKPITYEVTPVTDEVIKPLTDDSKSLTDEAIPRAVANESVNLHMDETYNQLEGKTDVKETEGRGIVLSFENKDEILNVTKSSDAGAGAEAEMEVTKLEDSSSEATNDFKASFEENESCVSSLKPTDIQFEGETHCMKIDTPEKFNLFSDISYLSKERSISNVDTKSIEENNGSLEVVGVKSGDSMKEFFPINWYDLDEKANENRTEMETLNNSASKLESESEEGGEFWERQMAAWQEAAEQTKELLYEAYQNEDTILESEDDFLDSTKSPVSSQKSPFSSSDRLDNESDDEGTYVSYDTTDDDEMVRFNAEDIDALRSELCLKLGDLNGARTPAPDNSEEDSNDVMFINYKTNCPSTLSPIKEEVLTDLDISQTSEMEESSSLEFTEINRDGDQTVNDDNPFFVVPPFSNMPSTNIEQTETLPSLELTSEEAKDSLILEDLDYDGTPTPATVIGPIIPSVATEDVLLVDTLTNDVTLIESGRPQSHIAFLEKNEEEPFPPPSKDDPHFEDDVAFESLPYEDNSGHFSSSFPPRSAPSFTDEPPIDPKEIEDSSQHNYQSYFTSGLSSITYPTPSLEGKDAFESADHISLPYDVNLPFKEKDNDEEWAEPTKPVLHAEDSPHQLERTFSVESEKEALILDESPPTETSPFVTLSFLGRLYNAEESNANKSEEAQHPIPELRATQDNSLDQSSSTDQYFSIKSYSDSSDDEIEEDLPPDTTPSKQGTKTPTPVRTPSHLADFIWRPDPGQCYTPDWESDSECNEDVESSSTSGEFIWQAGGDSSLNTVSCLPAIDKTSLEWQMANEKKEEEPPSPSSSSHEEDSESGEEEFTPSTWNKELTPHRSLLKSPETSSNGKKSVHWKRQRHHRVYEYPPEPQSWHSEVAHSSPRRTWPGPSLDYLTLADFELGGDEFLGDDSDDFEEFYHDGKGSLNPQIFSLAPLTYDKSGDLYSDGCEFYMGSPGTAYAFSRSSFTPAEFFPSDDHLTLDDFISKDEGKDEASGDHEGLSPPQNVLTKHILPEDAKLAREKLRLDLPTICLQENDPQDTANDTV